MKHVILKKSYGKVKSYYLVDKDGNKIPDGYNVHGDKTYKTVISIK